MRSEGCLNCGHGTLKDAFLTTDSGNLCYVEGKPTLKKQLLGKQRKLIVRICAKCRYVHVFG